MLRDWWTKADEIEYQKRVTMLVEQFNGFGALPGLKVNGKGGPLRNLPKLYAAFGVKEGDKLFLPPDQRVKIW